MPRAVSIPARLPARLYRRAPPPPENRLYHKDYTPPTASSSSSEHLTLESADGVSFYIPTYLVRRSWFFDDLISVPGPKGVVCLDAISASVLAFELGCAGDSRRTRRHSAPPLQPRRQSRAPDGGAVRGSGLAFGFAATSHPPLIPPCAWSWQFLKQVLDLAFAFNLTHALERLAADSGEFYDPVLGYTLWALVAAAKGERESGTRSPPGTTGNAGAGTGVAFPSASAASASASASPPNSTLLAWAHQLLRYDGAIPAWCTWALRTHVPDALSALEGLFAARSAVNAQIAASDARIAAGATARQKEASWEEGLSKRHSFDIFVRRQSVATFFLRVVDMNAPPSTTITNTSAAAHDKPLQRRKSLRGAKTQPTKCTPACRPTLKRKLTAAVGLVTRQSITEKFGTVEYFVEYTYEGIVCPACRDKAKEALVWVWCMKGPWHGGMGL